MAVSKRLRHEVMRRDNHTCRYCGGTAPDVKLTIDHVTPTTLGGSDEPSNLVTACADCNAGKSATPPDAALVADVDQRAVEYAQAMEVAIQRRAAELAADRGRIDRFDMAWMRWKNGDTEMPRDPGWRASIVRFLASGLTDEFLEDAVEIAMTTRKVRNGGIWPYFCGVCWREIEKIQEMASEVMGNSTAALAAPAQSGERPGLPVAFDQLNLADYFLTSVTVLFLGTDDQECITEVDDLISQAFWAAMSTAYAQFASRENDLVASESGDVLDALRDAALPLLRQAGERLGKEPSFYGA